MDTTAQKLDHTIVTHSNLGIFQLLVTQDFQVHTAKELLTKISDTPCKTISF
jgi:hypothetical protein